MALDYAGRDAEALAAYEAAARGGLWLPTGVERHADLLVRLGRRDDAARLLNAESNRANPALAAALARVNAGERAAVEPLTPARGAAAGLYGLSAIFLGESDSTNGLAALTLALMLDPAYDGARLAFAQEHARLGHIDLARAALARIAPESPYAGAARMMEAWVLLDSGAEEEAIELARANAASGDLRARRTLADMYRNLGRYGEAEPIYTSMLADSPNDWRLHFARGAARERLGRWPDAEADLRRALELSPDQPEVLNYLGYSWIDRGEHLEEGLAMIRRAVELRPGSGAIIDSLGWAYYRLGDYAQALDHLERAVELEPADPTLNDHLGDVYWRLGRRIEARFQWQRALTLEPDNSAAIEAKLSGGLPAEPASRSANR
jgi:Flp pilus assembly protein TadD